MEDLKNTKIVMVLDEVRKRILKEGINGNAKLDELYLFIDSWESWVLENALYTFGVDSEGLDYVKSIKFEFQLPPLMEDNSKYGIALLSTLKYLALRNDYFYDEIMRIYFKQKPKEQ